MGLILIGAMLAIIVSIVCLITKKVRIDKIIYISICIIMCSALISIISPTEYSDWYIEKEVEIHPLYYENSNPIYIKYENGQYIYRYEVEENMWTDTAKEYATNKVYANIIEDPNCDMPECIEYKSKPIETSWTLGLIGKIEKKYVLYVPEGSVKY